MCYLEGMLGFGEEGVLLSVFCLDDTKVGGGGWIY